MNEKNKINENFETIERKVLRIVFLGASNSGKTSLIQSFQRIEFMEIQPSTIGCEKYESKMYFNEKEIKLILWDTSGNERFRSFSIRQIKMANAIIICFDINDRKSFDEVLFWLGKIDEIKKSTDILIYPIALFGCKCDIGKREVSEEEIKQFSKDYNMIYRETSAKHYINVKEGIETIASLEFENLRKKEFLIVNSLSEIKNNNVKELKGKNNILKKIYKYINY